MIVIDSHGRIADINPAADRMIGVSVSQTVGRAVWETFSPWPSLFEKFRDTREGRQEVVVGKGEARRHFEVTFSPLYDLQDNFAGRVILLRALHNSSVPTFRLATEKIASWNNTEFEVHHEDEQSFQPDHDPLSDIPLLGRLTDSFLPLSERMPRFFITLTPVCPLSQSVPSLRSCAWLPYSHRSSPCSPALTLKVFLLVL